MIRTLTALLVLIMTTAASPDARASDEPAFELVRAQGAIQVRDYPALILAEVEVRGDMTRAGNQGFRPLAGFIFGDNQAPSGGGASANIAMTSPVIQTRSERIAMTSPVTQTRSGAQADAWRVAFIMPASWTMETLPRPNDPGVTLREQPARRLAAIRFSGGPDENRFARKAEELAAFLTAQGYEMIGEPVYARYNPPWTPTPMRRNEVLIEIAR
jgi:hypothetical protein